MTFTDTVECAAAAKTKAPTKKDDFKLLISNTPSQFVQATLVNTGVARTVTP